MSKSWFEHPTLSRGVQRGMLTKRYHQKDGAKVALEVLKKVSQRFFSVLWVPFGAFGVQFWSLFGVSCSLVHFCIDFGSQNGATIDDLGRS